MVTGVESLQFVDSLTAKLRPDGASQARVHRRQPEPVAAGDSLKVDVYNMNLRDEVAATPTTAGIYISTDATITTSDTLLTTISTSATLATVSQPGYYDHQTVTVALRGNLAPGTYYVGGLADYNNHLTETDETNNAYNVTQITVAAPSSPAAQTTTMGDNFVLAQTDTGQGSNSRGADHAQLAQLVSAQATTAQQLADTTDARFMFDHASDVAQHHISDYHLV